MPGPPAADVKVEVLTEREVAYYQAELRGAMRSLGFGVGLTAPGLAYFVVGQRAEIPPLMAVGGVLATAGLMLVTWGIVRKRRVPAAARELNDYQINGAAAGIATILVLVVLPGTMLISAFPAGS